MEDSKCEPSTFWQDARLAWSFRSFFLPFLFPAGCLLLLALVQANLLFGSTIAGQRIIDTLNSRWGGVSPVTAGPPRVLGFALAANSPFILALFMAGLLLLAAAMGIGTEQLRIGLSQKFRLRLQRELLQALTVESGEMRAQRQTGEMIKTFMTDAGRAQRAAHLRSFGSFREWRQGSDLRHWSLWDPRWLEDTFDHRAADNCLSNAGEPIIFQRGTTRH